MNKCIAIAATLVMATAGTATAAPYGLFQIEMSRTGRITDSRGGRIRCTEIRFGATSDGAGRRTRAPITCRTTADAATPLVFEALHENDRGNAILEIFNTGATGDTKVMTLNLRNVYVQSATVVVSATGSSVPTLDLVLAYEDGLIQNEIAPIREGHL